MFYITYAFCTVLTIYRLVFMDVESVSDIPINK